VTGLRLVLADDAAADFGASLRQARERRGVTLHQIAAATRIPVVALEALERNEISRLPGGIFSRAFVRAYAREVGLDPERTVRDFLARFPEDESIAGAGSAKSRNPQPPAQEPWQASRGLVGVIGATVLLLLVVLYFVLGGPY
jgi:cytoskeleton protein RodZ